MGFIKITKNELRYGTHENLIGMPLIQSSEENLGENADKFRWDIVNTIPQQKLKSKESFIPVLIEKNEQFELNKQGQINVSKLIGRVIIKNPGVGDKIWDIKINIQDPTNKIGKQYIIQELNPKDQWTQEFTFENPTESPLKIIENVSNVKYEIDRKTRISPILLKNVQNHLFFTVIIENSKANDIQNLDIYKRLPETVQKIVECKVDSGNVEYDRSHITWHVDRLPAKTKIMLTCKTAVDTKVTTSGKIQVRYTLKEQFNDFFVDSLTGLTRMGDFLSIKEKDLKPGHWECEASFLNRSEFSIKLNSYDVKLKETDNASFVNIREPISLNAGEKYQSPIWEIESADRPAFYKHLDFSIKSDLNFIRTGIIQLDDLSINIFDLEARKEFSQTIYQSFKESILDSTIKVNNLSTVALNHFFIQDTIAKHFIPPPKEDIQILIDGKELNWREISTENRYQTLERKRTNLLDQFDTWTDEIKGLQSKLGSLSKDQSKIDVKALETQLTGVNSAIENLNKSMIQVNKQKEGLFKKNKEKEESIEQWKKDLDEIQKELSNTKELQDITNTLTKETELGSKLTQEVNVIKQDIQIKEKSLSDAKNIHLNLTKKRTILQAKQNELAKGEEQTSSEFEETKQKLKLDKANQALSEKQKSIKTKLGDLKKEQSQLKKDLSNCTSEITKSETEIKQIGEILKNLNNQLQDLQKQVDQKSLKIKSILESAKRLPKPEILAEKTQELTAKTNEVKNLINGALSELKDINTKIIPFDQEINKIKKEKAIQDDLKKGLDEKLKKGTDFQSLGEKIQSEITSLEKKCTEYVEKIKVLDAEINQVSEKGSKPSDLDESFENLCTIPEFSGVTVKISPNDEDSNVLHNINISLINLEKIRNSVGIGQSIEIKYPLKCSGLNPNLQADYIFPTTITCNSIPLSSPYRLNIDQKDLPSIEIEHKRQRISLGRIVDHYAEAGKFDIRLIVKNDSNITLTDIEIYDTIPKEAELSNTEYLFTKGKHARPELSRIVWKLEKLNPYQELEISYLLSLPDERSYSLNDMDLSIK